MQMEVKEQIERLRNELHRHNYNYYVLNVPEISDQEFDRMMRELQDIPNLTSRTRRRGAWGAT